MRELQCEGWAETRNHGKGKDCSAVMESFGQSILHYWCSRHAKLRPEGAAPFGNGAYYMTEPYSRPFKRDDTPD